MRFLFTTFEGGGHVPPAILVARLLQSRGHEILFASDEANRRQVEHAGLTFRPWVTAPNRTALGQADDPLNDWRPRFPPHIVGAICDGVICGPAGAYSRDTKDLIRTFKPHVVVSNELLFGCMLAAEALAVPLALLTSNVWCFPTRPDLPPFGPGFAPARTRFQVNRESSARAMISSWYQSRLPLLNKARAESGLAPLQRTLDQLSTAKLILLGVSRSFDYESSAPPPFVYAGPLAEAPSWVEEARVEALVSKDRPNVLVSFSTTYQAQDRTLARCIRALSQLPVHGIVTTGPAIDPARLPVGSNVVVVPSASHDAILPHCAAMLCHGGHGTIVRPLMHGVPVVCLPTGRDQPENAQRIASAGAGIRLARNGSIGKIVRAVRRVLGEPAYRAAARSLGARIARDADSGLRAAAALEQLGVSEGGSSSARRLPAS